MSMERQSLQVDIACVGFGPATGGFLTTLSRALLNPDGTPALASRVAPGLPLQVLCYERADDLAFGVSGVVTRARAIRASFPDLDVTQIPLAGPVSSEKVVYLLDPVGASRRTAALRALDGMLKAGMTVMPGAHHAVTLPYIPPFLRKDHGLMLALGQFNQWVANQVMASGAVQIWPGMPVAAPLFDGDRVTGVRLADQGVGRDGAPTGAYLPGMDVLAGLTVVGDGPIGPIGRQLDRHFGLPAGHHQRDWAVGMKMVVELPPDSPLTAGTVIHTLGYPEPEIFGFLYVYPNRLATLGIFVPSWFNNPVRTSYRYLQHWMQHPYLWPSLAGGKLRSWGAKTLFESGRRGEPLLAGHGFARIGEGSGSTNVLTNSGVDEAWYTGVLLAESVIELARTDAPFDHAHLDATYVRRRRASWLESEAKVAEEARDGFQKGFIMGVLGTGLTGLTGGRITLSADILRPQEHLPPVETFAAGRIPPADLARLQAECAAAKTPLHDALMDRVGWPPIKHDGQLLISQQDALLLGGKVQAPAGYADHIVFLYPTLCEHCGTRTCIEICSAQALSPGDTGGVPAFDREKCVHCGACVWNCSRSLPEDPERGNIEFRAGAGGLHSAEN